MLVNASSEGNIKPTLVMDAFAAEYGAVLAENAYTVTREETYTNVARKNRRPRLVPLDAIGNDIV